MTAHGVRFPVRAWDTEQFAAIGAFNAAAPPAVDVGDRALNMNISMTGTVASAIAERWDLHGLDWRGHLCSCSPVCSAAWCAENWLRYHRG